MIIDVHAHIFPDKLAEKAIASLTEHAGEYKPFTDGTLSCLLASMNANRIDSSWIANIATKSPHASAILEWSQTIASDRIMPLASIYPLSPDFESEIVRFRKAGFCGIKLHPFYQNFLADDSAVFSFFSAVEKSGMFVLIHAGNDIAFPGEDNAAPERIVKLIDRFPGIPFIAAHLGGWNVWDEVKTSLVGRNVYFDTSFLNEVPLPLRDYIIERHGTEKLLFASDSPWQDQGVQITAVQKLPIGDADKDKIFSLNALALLERTRYVSGSV